MSLKRLLTVTKRNSLYIIGTEKGLKISGGFVAVVTVVGMLVSIKSPETGQYIIDNATPLIAGVGTISGLIITIFGAKKDKE